MLTLRFAWNVASGTIASVLSAEVTSGAKAAYSVAGDTSITTLPLTVYPATSDPRRLTVGRSNALAPLQVPSEVADPAATAAGGTAGADRAAGRSDSSASSAALPRVKRWRVKVQRRTRRSVAEATMSAVTLRGAGRTEPVTERRGRGGTSSPRETWSRTVR